MILPRLRYSRYWFAFTVYESAQSAMQELGIESQKPCAYLILTSARAGSRQVKRFGPFSSAGQSPAVEAPTRLQAKFSLHDGFKENFVGKGTHKNELDE